MPVLRYSHGNASIHRWIILAGISMMLLATLASRPAMGFEKLPGEEESDVVIVIKNKAFHVIGGDPDRPFFMMEAGVDHIITIRNEDKVAHAFMSPYFKNLEIQVSGDATMVIKDEASGFLIPPGKTVTLRFAAPELPEGSTMIEEVFWCDIHGKHPLSRMRGEMVLTQTRRFLDEE